VLYITTSKRASLDSTKSPFLFIQEGPVCSITLRNHNILLALNGIVPPQGKVQQWYREKTFTTADVNSFSFW